MKSASKKTSKNVGGTSVSRRRQSRSASQESGRKPASAVDGLRRGEVPSHIGKKAKLPFVAVTFAMTVDGKITTKNFSPVDFTSREDKMHLLRQRALGDAVLIGHSTLKQDNVRLGLPYTDLRESRVARGQTPYPLRVIVSNEGKIDHRLNIFQSDVSPVVIFSTTRMPRKYRAALVGKAALHLSKSRKIDLT